jgi:YD repeat-containing protein
LVSQLTYLYNSANQRIVETEDDGTVTTWTYDHKYQLLNEHRGGGPSGTSFNVTHTYDRAGNRVSMNDGL